MKTTVLQPDELCAMYCRYFNVEMLEEAAAIPEDFSDDEARVMEDFAYLQEARSTEERIERFTYRLNETERSKRCRRAYEMVMNGCNEADKMVLAEKAGLVSVENYVNMLLAGAEREEYEERAQTEGLSLDDYLEMTAVFAKGENFTDEEKAALARSKRENISLADIALNMKASGELTQNERYETIEEGKSFYAEKTEEYGQAAELSPGGGAAYYYKLYEIMNGPLSREERMEDRIREAQDPDLPLNREILADLARAAAQQDGDIFKSYEVKYGGQSDDFFYHLGKYAAGKGYISSALGERERREMLAGEILNAAQEQAVPL